jgi:hypothetical protein
LRGASEVPRHRSGCLIRCTAKNTPRSASNAKQTLHEQQKTFNAKFRGHYQYYGRPTNSQSLLVDDSNLNPFPYQAKHASIADPFLPDGEIRGQPFRNKLARWGL